MINPDVERSMYKRAGAEVTEIKGSQSRLLAAPTKDTYNAGGLAAKRSKFRPATLCISPNRMTWLA
jgi:hypothetical protein